MRSSYRFVALTVAALAVAAPATAQVVRPDEWDRGTTLTGFAGMAFDSSRQGPLFGGTVGWELTQIFAIEGTGMWVHPGSNADVFAAALKVRTALFGGRQRLRGAVPFLQAGIGFYRATFEGSEEIPDFYRHRMARDVSPGTSSFTDPSFVFGGGADVFISRNLAIRPDVEAMLVFRNSDSHIVTAIRFNVVYHIEDHPVTPSRRAGRQR
jgi:hypothetical protein